MRNKLRFLIIVMVLLLPIRVFATEYKASITGDNIIHSKSDSKSTNERMKSSIYIDVSNLDRISSLELYVTYDTNLVGISTCNTFNFIATGCTITSDKKIYFNYKDSLYDASHHMFTVTFMYTDNTPKNGTTDINVSFKNVKDKDGNIIQINTVNKKMTFDEPVYRINMSSKTEKTTVSDKDASSRVQTTTSVASKVDTSNKVSSSSVSDNDYISKEQSKEHDTDYDMTSQSKKEIKESSRKSKNLNINKGAIKIIITIIALTLIISLFALIITKRKDRKLDSMLDDFDKF